VSSRTISSYEEPDVGKVPYSDTLGWATVQLLINDCFDFSRGRSSTIPMKITDGSPASVLFSIFSINIDDYTGLREEIDRRTAGTCLEIISNTKSADDNIGL
jgi:hypothetical protein